MRLQRGRHSCPSVSITAPAISFGSIDFPNRQTLIAAEVAVALRVCEKHVVDLVNEGELVEESRSTARSAVRVSFASYCDFVRARTRGFPPVRPPKRLPYASVEFESERPLLTKEVAAKLSMTAKHAERLIATGVCAIDCRGKGSSRAVWRVPVESYRDFLAGCFRRASRSLKPLSH